MLTPPARLSYLLPHESAPSGRSQRAGARAARKAISYQSSLVPLPNDTILAVMHSEEFIKLPDGREAREVNAWLCRSHDLGRTWGEPESLLFE